MHLDTTFIAFEADHRRQALLADAENFRLARLARRGRTPDPPEPVVPPPTVNVDANRRYAVSR